MAGIDARIEAGVLGFQLSVGGGGDDDGHASGNGHGGGGGGHGGGNEEQSRAFFVATPADPAMGLAFEQVRVTLS